jgi:hypothetical protein
VVTVSMYSTRYWYIRTQQSGRSAVTPPAVRRSTAPGCVPDPGRAGFDIDVARLFYRAGSSKVDHRETMHAHYVPTDAVVCS